MLVRGDFTDAKLRELIDTSAEISTIDVTECTNEEFMHGFSDTSQPNNENSQDEQDSSKAEPQPGDYVIQKEAGKAKQITKTKKKK